MRRRLLESRNVPAVMGEGFGVLQHHLERRFVARQRLEDLRMLGKGLEGGRLRSKRLEAVGVDRESGRNLVVDSIGGAAVVRGQLLRRLGKRFEGFGIAGDRLESVRIGGKRLHHHRVLRESAEVRILGELPESRIFDHRVEGVGLHQLRHRGVAECHVLVPDLGIHIALSCANGALTWPERRIDAPESIRTNTDREHCCGGQNHPAIIGS